MLVIVYLRREHFLTNTYNKLSRRKFEPYYILKEFGPNKYLLDLSKDVPTSPTANNTELYEYHGEIPSIDDV